VGRDLGVAEPRQQLARAGGDLAPLGEPAAIVATPRCRAATGCGITTSSPSSTIRPAVGWCAPARTLMSVDFPAPF